MNTTQAFGLVLGALALSACSILRSGDDFVVGDGGVDAASDMQVEAGCTSALECAGMFANADAACVDGACVLDVCAARFADCNGNPDDGCEEPLGTTANCGACGDACDGVCDTTTATPACAATCGMQTQCGDVCVDTRDDPTACGGCDMPCPTGPGVLMATCAMSACGLECQMGFANCSDAPGCETNTTNDVMNCGGCGETCAAGPGAGGVACVLGVCENTMCTGTLADCDAGEAGGQANGCEVDTSDDVMNCGGCGIACDDGLSCLEGACVDRFVEVSTGRTHACGLRASGEVWCWGDNESRQLGGDIPRPQETPAPLRWEGETARARDVGAGESYTCFISDRDDSRGELFCLGSRGSGRLGRTTSGSGIGAVEFADGVEARADFVKIYTGQFHSCAISEDGALYCWGEGSFGQTGLTPLGGGNPNPTRLAHPIALPGEGMDSRVRSVALGLRHTCVATMGGGAYCFGENQMGALGSGPGGIRETPASVRFEGAPLENVREVFARWQATCALTNDGDLFCWGSNVAKALSDGPEGFLDTAQRLASDVDAAWTPYLGVCWMQDGVATCRGRNFDGQYGTGFIDDIELAPRVIDALAGVQRAEGNFEYSCGFRDERMVCWGYADLGELPRASLLEERAAQVIDASGEVLRDLEGVSLGRDHICALRGGQVVCWGSGGSNFPLGVPTQLPSVTAQPVPMMRGARDVATSPTGGCAIVQDGDRPDGVYCWGRQPADLGSGVVGLVRTAPTLVEGVPGASQIDYGGQHACTIGEGSGEVTCWGANDSGQLGVAAVDTVLAPTAVEIDGAPLVAQALALGTSFSCALEAAGTVVCWGLGSSGQIGDGMRAGVSPPTRLGLSGVSALGAGDRHACAVAGGELLCWGSNEFGQLGVMGASRLTPTAVERPSVGGVLVDVVGVAADLRSTCAVYEDGNVRCAGNNDFFQLGHEGASAAAVTEPVEGLADASEIDGFGFGYCARTTGGDWRCWGHNRSGRFGTDRDVSLPPTRIAR